MCQQSILIDSNWPYELWRCSVCEKKVWIEEKKKIAKEILCIHLIQYLSAQNFSYSSLISLLLSSSKTNPLKKLRRDNPFIFREQKSGEEKREKKKLKKKYSHQTFFKDFLMQIFFLFRKKKGNKFPWNRFSWFYVTKPRDLDEKKKTNQRKRQKSAAKTFRNSVRNNLKTAYFLSDR